MKRLLVAAALGLTAVAALAQGQFNFGNRVTVAGIDAKVFDNSGAALEGTAYWAQAYVGMDAGSLAPVGSPVNFRTGAAAGYISSAIVTVDGIAGGTAVQLQMRAWEASGGNSYEAALAAGALVGESNVIPITLQVAPNTPPDMVGLTSFNLVPEPSTMALGVLGVAALLLRRRN
jgi:hypothetical protein